MKKLKLLRCSKTKRSQYGLRRKMKIFEVAEFSRFKKDKNMNWAKNWKVPIWFKKKKNSEISEFSILSYTKTENSEISEILFTLDFDTGFNSRFKNAKEMNINYF